MSTFNLPLASSGPSGHSSSSAAAPLAIQDATQDAAPPQTEQSPELIAFLQAQQAKAERLAKRKEEAERLKVCPVAQSKKWEKMIGKHANDCKSFIADIGTSTCPDEIKSSNTKLFRSMLKQLTSMKADLQDCTKEAAEQLITEAPALEVEFKGLIRKWKKVNKLLS